MNALFRFGAEQAVEFQVIWKDGERVLGRGWRLSPSGEHRPVLAVWPAAAHPAPSTLARLEHEYSLKDELESAWAVRPLELLHEHGHPVLLLEDPGGDPLERRLGTPLDVGTALRLAINISAALGHVHQRGLIHKDLKPAHILVSGVFDAVRLAGFGLASRLPRERQVPTPPEEIAGTLAYMAPEQTGRMNRSIDARSDLYALGVSLYQILTGVLPFTASDAMDWVHCHLARRPVPPAERVSSIPAVVSDIVMKLLAKPAEERYQTAAGLEADLLHCLAAWEKQERIGPFPLGGQDHPGQLMSPERLYGRDREIASLLAAFDRVAAGGAPELMLVSGYSGIGKTSVVQELQHALVPPRGLFASGKFDQHKRDIPYTTLAQALQGLIRPLLGKSEAELATWRTALAEALGPNAALMVPLIPELELILGPQPLAPTLLPQDAQLRFRRVFSRLIGVFARPAHPLALFLDDLQWLDAATLELLEHLLIRSELRYLLIIGAYRDNEVVAGHPLLHRLSAIRQADGRVGEILLGRLGPEEAGRLVADAMCSTPQDVASLADLVYEKTAGNPFFAIQFLSALADEGLLSLDRARGWTWDLEQIRAKGFADNVVDLVLDKLGRLPAATQHALKQLACLGCDATVDTLTLVEQCSEVTLDDALRDAVRAGLVIRHARGYRFVHDRVQEAAYALIPNEARPAVHLAIGRRLLAATQPEAMAEAVFEIVGQLNRGTALVDTDQERERLAELDLLAGCRAREAAAYASALTYLAAAAACLTPNIAARRSELAFALDLHRAECEFLTGNSAAAEACMADLAQRATNLPDLAAVTQMRLELFMAIGQRNRAVQAGLDYLSRAGIHWSAHPTDEAVRQEYEWVWQQLGDRPIEVLQVLPEMTDLIASGTMDVLVGLMQPAWYSDENLRSLVIGRMVRLSIAHGNSDASCLGYVWLSMILGPQSGDYALGFQFGQLGIALAERCRQSRFKARVYQVFGGYVMQWTQPIRTARSLVRHAFDIASKFGGLTYASFARSNNLIAHLLACGDSLADVQREAEALIRFARQAKLGLVIDQIVPQLQLVKTLRGQTAALGCFDDTGFHEAQFEQHLEADPRLTLPTCWYWVRKLQSRFFSGDHAAAIDAASKAKPLLWTSPSFFEQAEYRLYAALALAASYGNVDPAGRGAYLQALHAHHEQLQIWATHCPENFENRAALVGAEIARLGGRDTDAMRLYEDAIRSARDNGFVHNQALANELAARFYAERGFEKIARTYLQDARHGYLRWGADGKVRQLEALYPYLVEPETTRTATTTIGTPVEHLDLATVIAISQAVSGEIVLDKLLDTLMRIAIEQAGAQRGLLILLRGEEPRVAAEATICGDAVTVQLSDEAVEVRPLPVSILRHVLRTRENVALDNAATQGPFLDDPYVKRQQARSILCLPLLTQAKLIGALYLENSLASGVFAPACTAVLRLLASQASIALENNRLYRDLEQREAKIRRLVDANIIGICIWHFDGRVLDANEAFLCMIGYDQADLAAGKLSWTEMTPADWQDLDARLAQAFRQTGVVPPFEKEFFRKDGSRVPVLIGCAKFEEGERQGVAFVLDLTERKRAERVLQRTQAELAHVTRVTTLSALTASIAHEVNQPLAAIVTNANAALRWLARQPPDLREVQGRIERIVQDGHRADAVIGGVRALLKKSAAATALLDVNDLIADTIALIQGEVVRHQILLRTELAPALPQVVGDRVQLQQVLINLMMNGIEAMKEAEDSSRELRIRSTLNGSADAVEVAVCDVGIGLTPESMERVFEAFYTTKPDGLGMGLAICRLIVEAHGGRLWAELNTPHGTVFKFTLPADTHDSIASAGTGNTSETTPTP